MGRDRERELTANTYCTLYDPPQDGATPLDGSGQPSTSRVLLADRAAKLTRGFTERPVPDPASPAAMQADPNDPEETPAPAEPAEPADLPRDRPRR